MATQIRSFGMSQMTIGSCSDFHSKVLSFITTATPAALYVENQVASYTTAVNTLSSVVNRQRAFIATEAMKGTDRKRDNATGVISNVVNAYLTTPVVEKNAAAHLLSPQLSPYKGIRNHEYSKQTAEVKGMLTMLALPDNKAAITTLGLTGEVEILQTSNIAFEEAFLSKATEMSSRMAQSDVKSADAIAQANELYIEIIQIVNAYAIVQPSDEITTFIANINGLVGVYSHISGSSSGSGTTPGSGDDPANPGGGDEEERPEIK